MSTGLVPHIIDDFSNQLKEEELEVLSNHAASKINENQVYECRIFSSNSLNDLVKIKNGKIFRIEREHEKLFVYSDSPNSKN